MRTFQSSVTAKPLVLRLHRIKITELSLDITEIWQLRRREKAKAEIAVLLSFYFIYPQAVLKAMLNVKFVSKLLNLIIYSEKKTPQYKPLKSRPISQ